MYLAVSNSSYELNHSFVVLLKFFVSLLLHFLVIKCISHPYPWAYT